MRNLLICLSLLSVAATMAWGSPAQKKKALEPLAMTKAVICKDVKGYRDFEPLADTPLTRDDKLVFYCEPTGFTIQPDKDRKGYRAHLTTKGKVRRKGKKETLFERKDLLDYDVTAAYPPKLIYLKTSVSIKSLGPGEYEFDLTLTDELAKERTTTQVIPFTVAPSK